MPDVAVVAHSRKSFGGGLPELRKVLAREGVTDPLWDEVKKSRHAPACARRVAARGVDLMFVWGGDGTVQRCIDAVAGTDTAVAILPAGTANLLATNLKIPADLTQAVRTGLHGGRRRIDTGSVNGEHFTVMAGAGFDARLISEADRGLKDRLGRAAYLHTGIRNLNARRVKATVEVDGGRFFKGRVSCVLAGNVGQILGGVEAFPGRDRTTGSSNSAWSPRRTRPNGPGPSASSCSAERMSRRSSRLRAEPGSRSGSIGRSRTNLTAARAPRAGTCGFRSALAPSPCASRRRPRPFPPRREANTRESPPSAQFCARAGRLPRPPEPQPRTTHHGYRRRAGLHHPGHPGPPAVDPPGIGRSSGRSRYQQPDRRQRHGRHPWSRRSPGSAAMACYGR